MELVRPGYKIMAIMDSEYPLRLIEQAGRTCYKSEDKMDEVSSTTFTAMVLNRGHHSVIEHSAMTIRIICDRGVSHEIVRHRLAAYSQESTRYVNYKGGCTFIIPLWLDLKEGEYNAFDVLQMMKVKGDKVTDTDIWLASIAGATIDYNRLLDAGWSPQKARSVLPNSTKTEIVWTANFREWRHIFKLRCGPAAHPQMIEVMAPLHEEVKKLIPVIFDNL